MLVQMMNEKQSSSIGVINLLPFLLFFISIGIPFQQSDFVGSSSEESGIANQIVLSFIYLLAILQVLKHPRFLSWLMSKVILLELLFLLMLASALWSGYPGKVLISVIHNIGASFIAMSMAILLFHNKNKFYSVLLFAIFIYYLGTISVALFSPDRGVMPPTYLYGIGRWRGWTDNPNSLGCICFFGAWICSCVIFLSNASRKMFYFAILNLILGFYILNKTNSMTSIITSIAIVFCSLWFSTFYRVSNGSRLAKVALYVSIPVVSVVLLFVFHEFFSLDLFFKLTGRSENFTGRSVLWQTALEAFSVKPYFGWSYDSLRSFSSQYVFRYTELHNGYLDLLVRGGLISSAVFVLLLVQLVYLLFKKIIQGGLDYMAIAVLVMSVILHNMTESSILTNTSLPWLMFLLGSFYTMNLDGFFKKLPEPMTESRKPSNFI